MDMLTRLIAGSGTSPTKQRTNTPAERLATCKSICNALTQTWRNGSLEREDDAAFSYTTKLLQRLETILQDESRRAAPHSCLRYITSSQTYIIITKLAVASRNVDIIKTSAELFHILLNGEADGLLDSKLFARSLLDLVWYATIGGKIIVEERLETDLVELLFEIATKIRLDPDILPAWFYPDREIAHGRNTADDPRKSQFPLFHVLVQYVHHDGSVGDFARTALLYLTETASTFRPLETWMIESDLAPQMASGLGALYSRLSRQSTHFTSQKSVPRIVVLSDSTQSLVSPSETPSDGQQDLKAFFSYLAFWQDTLSHCKSVEVGDTLLDHFQVLFVQQLLYPSLLESSDVEGGSTAAVITHLSRILLALDHFQLVHRILRYLLASPNVQQEPKDKSQRRLRISISRRKSIDHLKALAEVTDSPSPDLFNLLDLVVMSLKSSHSETVSACLKLLSVIVQKHHCHVLRNIFKLEPTSHLSPPGEVNQFNDQLCRLFDYSAAIAPHEDLDASYQAALSDGQVLLEQHSCFTTTQDETETLNTRSMSIARECKLFDAVVTLLQNFFANSSVTNLYLTESLLSLAACGQMDLHGWLLPFHEKRRMEDNPAYIITSIIGDLVEQVRQWRSQFLEWDDLIQERRLQLADEDVSSSAPKQTISRRRDDLHSNSRSPVHLPPGTPRGNKTSAGEIASLDSVTPKTERHQPSREEHSSGRSSSHGFERPQEADASGRQDELLQEPSFASASLLKTQVALLSTNAPDEASASLPLHAGRKQITNLETSMHRLAPGEQGDSGTATPGGQDDQAIRNQASLSHLLTNSIILQEFILEIAAVVQLRATFFDEIQFEVKTAD